MNPVFYLLAGPNGPGKSTLYRSAVASGLLPAGAEFVNADVYEAQSLAHIEDTQKRSIQAREAGFAVVLLVVCVNDPRQLLARVAQRVAEGGHAVPTDRILARYPRTLQHLRQAIPLADLALLYDTSGVGRNGVAGPKLVARWRRAQWHWHVTRPPVWAKSVQPLS